MDTMGKKILVLGGGTAGWLTALYITKTFPQHEVTVMESKSIGMLGAGEGSTPPLVEFLKMLGVDIDELLERTKGTIKQGISFENWNGDGKKYFHPLKTRHEFTIPNLFDYGAYDYYLKHCCMLLLPVFKAVVLANIYYVKFTLSLFLSWDDMVYLILPLFTHLSL